MYEDVCVYLQYKISKIYTTRSQRENTQNVFSGKYTTKSFKQDHKTLEIYFQRYQVL